MTELYRLRLPFFGLLIAPLEFWELESYHLPRLLDREKTQDKLF